MEDIDYDALFADADRTLRMGNGAATMQGGTMADITYMGRPQDYMTSLMEGYSEEGNALKNGSERK